MQSPLDKSQQHKESNPHLIFEVFSVRPYVKIWNTIPSDMDKEDGFEQHCIVILPYVGPDPWARLYQYHSAYVPTGAQEGTEYTPCGNEIKR